MSRLSLILNKIFKGGDAHAAERAPQAAAPTTAQPAPTAPAPGAAPVPGGASPAPAGTTTTQSPTTPSPQSASPAPASGAGASAGIPSAANVDVGAVLAALAAKSGQKLDWKKSIVDLLKLLDLDSSLAARKELAAELQYTGDTNDSATMNTWLHKAVMKKLAENGGKVPDDLKD